MKAVIVCLYVEMGMAPQLKAERKLYETIGKVLPWG